MKMPKYLTKFNECWLSQADCNGQIVSDWCKEDSRKGKLNFAFCIRCNQSFSVGSKGFSDINQHARGKKHKSYTVPKGQTQFQLQSTGEVLFQTEKLWKKSHTDAVSAAEGIWALHMVRADDSFRSSDGISDVFQCMFPDSNIGKDFTMGRQKAMYILTHGLGPLFKEKLLYDVRRSKSFYSIIIDETTTSQVVKQMDILLRYWSMETGKVECRYYNSAFFGHAKASHVTDAVTSLIQSDGIPVNRMLMLSTDGPNVQLAVHKQMDTFLKENGSAGLVKIGTCNIHIVHNAFHHGLELLNWNIEDFSVDVYQFFKLSSARREDFEMIQKLLEMETHLFLRHVPSRWLTLAPVVRRLLEQYASLKDYFLNWLPKNDLKSVSGKPRYERICTMLKDPLFAAKLSFIDFLSEDFMKFQTMFQTEAPLIHILYSELSELLHNIMFKFLKTENVGTLSGKNLVGIDVSDERNQLKLDLMDIGVRTKMFLKKVSENEKKLFLLSVHQCFIGLVVKLQEKLPLSNQILIFLQCLHPLFRREKKGETYVKALANHLSHVFGNPKDMDNISTEWKLYSLETEIKVHWYQEEIVSIGEKTRIAWKRIDDYWSKVLAIRHPNGFDEKYPNLGQLVKAACVLSHGNADVERSFSFNKNIVSSERTLLSEKAIVAIRHVKDELKMHSFKPQNIPITKEFVSAVQQSRKKYRDSLNEEKVIKNDEKESQIASLETLAVQTKLLETTKEMDEKEKSLNTEMEASQYLLNEATKKLDSALKKGNLTDAKIAQALLHTSRNKIEESLKLQNDFNKQKRKLINKQNDVIVMKFAKKDNGKNVHVNK